MARAGRGCFVERPLPKLAGLHEEALARCSAFIAAAFAIIAINSLATGLHPDGWRLPATLNGLTQDSNGVNAGSNDVVPIFFVVVAIDTATGQINDRERALKALRPRPERPTVP